VFKFLLRVILVFLTLALIYVVMSSLGMSPENVSWIVVGFFKENSGFFQHPITLLVIAILIVVRLIKVRKLK